eukprot:4092965-Amphidinium_carterae.1
MLPLQHSRPSSQQDWLSNDLLACADILVWLMRVRSKDESSLILADQRRLAKVLLDTTSP